MSLQIIFLKFVYSLISFVILVWLLICFWFGTKMCTGCERDSDFPPGDYRWPCPGFPGFGTLGLARAWRELATGLDRVYPEAHRHLAAKIADYIRARTGKTSEAWIRSIFLVMNLLVLAGSFLRPLKTGLLNSYSLIKELFVRFELAPGTVELPVRFFQFRATGLKI